jgi:hypothetical protein
MGLSASAAHNVTKLLHLHPYLPISFHKLYNTNHEARVNFVICYLYGVYAGETDPTLILFHGEA